MAGVEWMRGGGTLDPQRLGRLRRDAEAWRLVRFGARRLAREEPLSFGSDKRGRVRALFEELTRAAFDPSDRIRGRPAPPPLHYGRDARTSTLVPFTAARLGLPERVAFVDLERWLDGDLRRSWEFPGAQGPHEVGRAYFRVAQEEWRRALRRMVRCGLVDLLAGAEARPAETAGVFAVAKTADEDRLIGDRRPRNAVEAPARKPALPYGPRLRRLRLADGECVHLQTRDLRHCFYLFAVSAGRRRIQQVGPRVPASWFRELFDEDADELPVAPAEGWWRQDLRRRRDAPPAPPNFVQPSIAAVVMGDLSAVSVVEHANPRILLECGALRPSELMLPGVPLQDRGPLADIYVDDLVILTLGRCIRPGSRRATVREEPRWLDVDLTRGARADAAWQRLGMPQSRGKALNGPAVAEVWGAELRCLTGTVGVPRGRRASLAFLCGLVVAEGCSRSSLRQLLGNLAFAFAYRREGFAALGKSFVAALALPGRRTSPMREPASDELLVAASLMPLLETNLRAAQVPKIYAMDASSTMGGGCVADISPGDWELFYRMSEERGACVRLDEHEAVGSLADNRPAAAELCLRQRWQTVFSYHFGRTAHINVLELEALLSMLRRLERGGATDQRVIVLLDSKVAVGAAAPGRSSSTRVNFVLRRLGGLLLQRGLLLEVVWLPTWANLADAPSRRGTLASWRRKLPELVPGQLRAAISDAAAAELAALQAPAWRPDEGGEGFAAASHSLLSAGEGAAAEAVGGTAGVVSPAGEPCGLEELRLLAHTPDEPSGKPIFWEIFAGRGALSRAFSRRRFWEVWPGVDSARGPVRADLGDGSIEAAVGGCLSHRRLRYVHFAPPCSRFSCAVRGSARLRSRASPEGPPHVERIASANRLVDATVRLCHRAAASGVFWSIENPRSSLLWHYPAVAELAAGDRVRAVDLDMCQYDARLDTDLPVYRKRTRILTIMDDLEVLRRRCAGGHTHHLLQGSFWYRSQRKWRGGAEAAAAYPPALCSAWAAASKWAMGRPPRSDADMERGLLLLAGDVEENPGPRRSRRTVVDVVTADVTRTTAQKYEAALARFDHHLRSGRRRGGVEESIASNSLVADAADYLRCAYSEGVVGSSHVGYVISGLTRLLYLIGAVGGRGSDAISLRPLWRILRSWLLAVPSEFRRPVERRVALALAAVFRVRGLERLAAYTIVAFHCLLRPHEACSLKRGDVFIFDAASREWYPGCHGIVRISAPKTARLRNHSKAQFVLVEDEGVATFVQRVLRELRGEALWPFGLAALHVEWRRALSFLGLDSLNLVPSGLRGGGATDYFLKTRNIPNLRRRGRWTSEKTLERYVQEAAYNWGAADEHLAAHNLIHGLSELAPSLLLGASADAAGGR